MSAVSGAQGEGLPEIHRLQDEVLTRANITLKQILDLRSLNQANAEFEKQNVQYAANNTNLENVLNTLQFLHLLYPGR